MKKRTREREPARWHALIQAIECGHPGEAWEAAQELSELNLKQSMGYLLKIMQSGKSPENREAAAFTLYRMGRSELIPDFAACVADKTQFENVRGQAAEALAYLTSFKRKNSLMFKQAEKILLANLDSPSPVVRFWCCFALGSMRSKLAIKPLTKLQQDDHAVCPRWWKICEEATDALHSIRTGYWPELERETHANH